MVLGFSLILTACITAQPRNITDVCAIFEENRNWYESASSSEDRWGIPIGVNMAVIYQESSFRARAKPERKRILWVLPGPRASSAYGYAQALDSTWDDYKSMSGRTRASRSDFNDAIEDAAELATFAKNLPCKINIIEYNPIEDGGFQQTTPERLDKFAKYLEDKKLVVNVRRSRGKDIDAACGQLANKH